MRQFRMRHTQSIHTIVISVFTLLYAITLTCTIPVQAQDREIEARISQLNKIFDAGKYSQSLHLAEQLLELSVKRYGEFDEYVGQALNQLGRIYSTLGYFSKANKLYSQALDVRIKANGKNSLPVAESLQNLGIFHWKNDRYSEAERLQNEALKIRTEIVGPSGTLVGSSHYSLGNINMSRGRFDLSEYHFRRAIEIRENKLGLESWETGVVVGSLAESFRKVQPFQRSRTTIPKSLINF